MGNHTEKKHKGHRCWSSKKWMGLSKRRLRGDDQSNVRIAVRSRHPSQTIDGNKYFKPCCACVKFFFFYTSVNAKLNAVILYFFGFSNLISVLFLLSHAWRSPLTLCLCGCVSVSVSPFLRDYKLNCLLIVDFPPSFT